MIREVSPSGAFENALKPLQYCKVISLQLIKINGKIKKLKKLKMNKLKKNALTTCMQPNLCDCLSC